MLLDKDLYVTGTIMKSRVPSPAHLITEKEMKKFQKGYCEQSVRNDSKVNLVQWYVKKTINLWSTELEKNSTIFCNRWSKKDSKYIEVSRSDIVKSNNDYDGKN